MVNKLVFLLAITMIAILASAFYRQKKPKSKDFDGKDFVLSADKLKLICSELVSQFEAELESSQKSMLPTFVDRFPTGDEEGTFMVIDIGGTNIRFDLILLKRNNPPAFLANCIKIIPDKYKKGTGIDLFDFVAREIIAFLQDKEIDVCHALIVCNRDFHFPLGLPFHFHYNRHP